MLLIFSYWKNLSTWDNYMSAFFHKPMQYLFVLRRNIPKTINFWEFWKMYEQPLKGNFFFFFFLQKPSHFCGNSFIGNTMDTLPLYSLNVPCCNTFYLFAFFTFHFLSLVMLGLCLHSLSYLFKWKGQLSWIRAWKMSLTH